MKRIIALIILAASLLALSSCTLIRKIDGKPAENTESKAEGDTYATDFSEKPAPETEPAPIRYTEEQAYDVLVHSFPDYDMDHVKIERTKTVVAENDGTEYYIYNVSLPKNKKADTTADTADGDTTDETTEIEMEKAAPYYVSVNGVVHKEIADNNKDTAYAEKTFFKKYGETDKDTGAAFKLAYEGVLKSGDNLCYNFAVYKGDAYAFNYLVTVDGAYSAETKIEH